MALFPAACSFRLATSEDALTATASANHEGDKIIAKTSQLAEPAKHNTIVGGSVVFLNGF